MNNDCEMFFMFTSPVSIEETFKDGRTLIAGTLLVEGRSRNRFLYSVDQMQQIADTAVGVPIRFGTEMRVDPNSGMLDPNMHATGEHNVVGKIVRTVFDKVKRKIKYWAEVVNTITHPKIAETVSKGWGVSIGGKAKSGMWVLDKLGKLALKAIGVTINHVQLLRPTTTRGQDEAQVEEVEIQETALAFNRLPPVRLHIKGESTRDISNIKKIKIDFA